MKKKFSRYIVPAAAVVIFCLVLMWFLIAVDSTENASRSQQLEAVRHSIEKGITLCYSIEGSYPESLEYLSENYGVHYDTERYIVHYNCFAANIRPTVMVAEKGL